MTLYWFSCAKMLHTVSRDTLRMHTRAQAAHEQRHMRLGGCGQHSGGLPSLLVFPASLATRSTHPG
jgi:hypothetical protein